LHRVYHFAMSLYLSRVVWPTVDVAAERLGIFQCRERSWQSWWSRSSRPAGGSWKARRPYTGRSTCRRAPTDAQRSIANRWLTWRKPQLAPPTSSW